MKIALIRSRSTDSAVFKVAETLSQNGHKVNLVVWDRLHNLKDSNRSYKINSLKLKAPYDTPKAIIFLPVWWIYEILFLLRNNFDIIHACDLDTLLPAIVINFIKGKKIFYIIYDFYADNVPGIPKLVRKVLSSIEIFAIRFSNILFLVDKSRYEQVREAKINEVVYLYNSPPDYFNKLKKRKYNSNDEIEIFYAGSIEKSRGLEYIIKAVEDLHHIKLTIAGTGVDKDIFEELTQKYQKTSYIGWIPYEEVIQRTLNADILFRFSDPKVPKNRYESPNKLFEAMMCGKPIIVSGDSSMADIVSNENCGIVIPYGDVSAIKEAIIKLRDDQEFYKILGMNGREAYEEKYSWKIMKKRLLNAYYKINRELGDKSNV